MSSREEPQSEELPLLPLPARLRAALRRVLPSRSHDPRVLPGGSRDAGTAREVCAGDDADEESAGDDADEECAAGPSGVTVEDRELREAIYDRDVDAVTRLLARGAPLTLRVDGNTPLHECIAYCSEHEYVPESRRAKEMKIIEEMLAASHNKSDVLNCLNFRERTPLYIAINEGDLNTVKALVSAGADIQHISGTGETALHVAARARHHHILKYFLENHNIPNNVEKHGYAAIHFAVFSREAESMKLLLEAFGPDQLSWPSNEGEAPWYYIAGWGNTLETAQYLTQDTKYNWDLNALDGSGTSPLYSSAFRGSVPLTKLLFRSGATLTVKGEKESAIKYIASEFNNPLTFFEDLFDECIYEKDYGCWIEVNYKVLAGCREEGASQIKVLEDLVRFGQSKILKHPTIESLIYFKWRCLQPVFYTIILTYVAFLLSFNAFVITTFYNMDTSNRTTCNTTYNTTHNTTCNTTLPTDEPDVRSCGWQHWTLVALIYLSTSVLISQECIWIYLQRLHHFRHPEAWVKLGVLLLALIMPVLLGCNSSPDDMRWARHLACAALLLAWLQAMLLLSRFPGWGYYVLMFERVAINILKILATTIFLVIGFSTCLMIQYQSTPPFDGPVAAFIKTLVMMLSEFDYGDLFYKTHDEELENTKTAVRLLFVLFVIFIAIVLMNFMTGVAVSDVNKLNIIGKIRRLEKQVELLSTLEGLGDTVLVKWWRKLTLIRFHTAMGRSLIQPGTIWEVDDLVNPDAYNYNDPVREIFPLELHNAILDIAKKKRQNVDKLDAVYDAVVGTPRHTHDSDSEVSNAPVTTTLNDRIKSIEDANKDIKQSIDDFKTDMNDKYDKILGIMAGGMSQRKVVSSKAGTRKRKMLRKKKYLKSIEDANKEIKQSIDDFNKNMNDKYDNILGIMAGGMSQGKVVSSKAVTRKRKMLRKKKYLKSIEDANKEIKQSIDDFNKNE